jgi:hypothetical protein
VSVSSVLTTLPFDQAVTTYLIRIQSAT